MEKAEKAAREAKVEKAGKAGKAAKVEKAANKRATDGGYRASTYPVARNEEAPSRVRRDASRRDVPSAKGENCRLGGELG